MSHYAAQKCLKDMLDTVIQLEEKYGQDCLRRIDREYTSAETGVLQGHVNKMMEILSRHNMEAIATPKIMSRVTVKHLKEVLRDPLLLTPSQDGLEFIRLVFSAYTIQLTNRIKASQRGREIIIRVLKLRERANDKDLPHF